MQVTASISERKLIADHWSLQQTKLLQKLTIFKQISNVQLLYSLRAIDRQTSMSPTLPKLMHLVEYSLE